MEITHTYRIVYFDWIRGCMILWMLTYHISLNYGKITYGVAEPNSPTIFTFMSFFMATFYVSSGYFFTMKQDAVSFFANKIKKILIPYCTFYIWGVIIYEIFFIITNGRISGLRMLLPSLISGCSATNTPLWFLVSLFMCNGLYYILNKCLQEKFVHLIVAICIALACITQNKTQIIGYGNILLGVSFVHVGVLLRRYQDKLIHIFCIAVSILIFLIIGIVFPQRLEFDRNILVQGNYILWFLFAIVACYTLWYISKLWKHDNVIGHSLINIGQTSLVIFAAHRPVLNWVIEPIIRNLYSEVSYSVFWFISLMLILLICYGLNYLLKAYCPVLIGEQSHNI